MDDDGEERIRDAVVAEFSPLLFASLPRKDQRLRGEQYLRGLLSAVGRKSIRNIASAFADPAAEQRMQHFITSSTWSWTPVREALARYADRTTTPQAWIVRSMSIPKEGERSVGVDHGFDPHLRRTFRGQQAFGVWLASDRVSTPVNWRLLLSGPWTRSLPRRARADAPGGLDPRTPEGCAVAAVLEDVGTWDVPSRPVVLDICSERGVAAACRLAAAGIPVIARLAGNVRFVADHPALPAWLRRPMAAHDLMESVKGLRRSTTWVPPEDPGATHTTLTAAVQAVPAARDAYDRSNRAFALLGEWHRSRRPVSELWITNMTEVPAGPLIQLTKLTLRVRHDLSAIGVPAGLKDFEGRSFHGWHRHITLASAAHTIRALSAAGQAGRGSARVPTA